VDLKCHGTVLYYNGNGKALASGNSWISLLEYYMKIASIMLCDTVSNGFWTSLFDTLEKWVGSSLWACSNITPLTCGEMEVYSLASSDHGTTLRWVFTFTSQLVYSHGTGSHFQLFIRLGRTRLIRILLWGNK
jgi:hypothetical protein